MRSLYLDCPKNSPYGVMDCGGDGECFFHCLAHSMNVVDPIHSSYQPHDLRQLICDHLTDDKYQFMIDIYKIMKDADDFHESWDPYDIHSLEDFKDVLMEGGNSYWCDYLLFNHLSEILSLNIMILTHSIGTNDISFYNTLRTYEPSHSTIFLLYENECHFKLIGYFDTQMISSFNDDTLPQELRHICMID